MTKHPVSATPGMFRSPLAPAAAVCLSLASVLGLGALAFWLDPGYSAALAERSCEAASAPHRPSAYGR